MSTTYVTGVLENGTPRDERRVPNNPRRPIRYIRGETLAIFIDVLQSDGVPVDLTGGVVKLTIKKSTEYNETIVSLDATLTGAQYGQAKLWVAAASFADHEPGRYIYDVWLISGEDRNAIIPASPFIVEPSVRTI